MRNTAARLVSDPGQRYLVALIPAVLIPGAQLGSVVEQGLAAGRLAPCQHGVIQRGQATAVLVVRRRSERQKSLTGRHRGQDERVCVGVESEMLHQSQFYLFNSKPSLD